MRKKSLHKHDFDRALAYAFLLLKYRLRSRHETISRLNKKGYAPETVQRVVDYLQEYKYLDDDNFAHAFIAYAIAKGWGPRKIHFELKRLGIPEALGEEALAKSSYQEKLKDLIEQKLGYYRSRNKKAPFFQIRQKMLRSLMMRGFSYQEIAAAMENQGTEHSEGI